MHEVMTALVDAFKSLLHPKMLTLMIWPMVVAMLIWGIVAFFYWDGWVAWLGAAIDGTSVQDFIDRSDTLTWIAGYLIVFLVFLLWLPMVFVTALLITSIFAMPMMISHVAKRAYPDLERKKGLSNTGSIFNAGAATGLYLFLWVVTLPVWLFSPLAAVLPILLAGFLNQRLFRYDALAEHASREEYRIIIQTATGKLYLLGILLGLIQFIPVLNFFSPVYIGLAFIHLCLSELEKLRRNGASLSPVAGA